MKNFEEKIKLATLLWPQTEDDIVNYLIGGDYGLELALRGEPALRTKRRESFKPILSKSKDIAIFDVKIVDYPQSFRSQVDYNVFFNPKTEKLSDLPDTLLDDTKERVYYNDESYYTPEMEILFLDAFLNGKREYAKQLLLNYDLNLNKINEYFLSYYAHPIVKKYDEESIDAEYYKTLIAIYTMIKKIVIAYQEKGLSFIQTKLNQTIKKMIDSDGQFYNYNAKDLPYPLVLTDSYDLTKEEKDNIKLRIIEHRKDVIWSMTQDMGFINELFIECDTKDNNRGIVK